LFAEIRQQGGDVLGGERGPTPAAAATWSMGTESTPTCPNSGQVADRLTALGYTDVRIYRDGIEDRVTAGLPIESA
jgi:hypothetical protein